MDFFTTLILERSGMSVKEAIHEAIPYISSVVRPMYDKIDPIKFGEHRRALAEAEEYARRLLHRAGRGDMAYEIAGKLVAHYPAHSFVIDRKEASSELGLPVSRMEDSLFDELGPLCLAVSAQPRSIFGFVTSDENTAPGRVRGRSVAVGADKAGMRVINRKEKEEADVPEHPSKKS